MHTQTATAAPSPRAARDHILGELAAFAAARRALPRAIVSRWFN